MDGRCYVVEVLDADWTPRAEMIWLPVVEIGHRDLRPSTDFDTLASVVAQAAAYDIDPAGFFASSGYFERLRVWVASKLTRHELTLGDDWTQYNMGPSFCLIRFETNGPDIWFKAVGEPNLREYSITIKLSERYPGYLPRVLGSHPEWHGWLMCDGNGRHPDALCDLNSWQIVARSLAALQINSAADSETLLSVGCLDLRLGYLNVQMDDLFETIAHLMRLQTTSHPKPLTDLELSITKLQLKRSLQSLVDVGLPDTLVHLDLNAGNILVCSDRAVFLDWMQGGVGLPLLAIEYLMALVQRLRPDKPDWPGAVLEAYIRVWQALVSRDRLVRACCFTPIVAAMAFAVACLDWRKDAQAMDPHTAKLLRSIARRMYLEANRLEVR